LAIGAHDRASMAVMHDRFMPHAPLDDHEPN
jgi:hypothetical protein